MQRESDEEPLEFTISQQGTTSLLTCPSKNQRTPYTRPVENVRNNKIRNPIPRAKGSSDSTTFKMESRVEESYNQDPSQRVDELGDKFERDDIRTQVKHEFVVPTGYPFIPLDEFVPSKLPARKYPFALDPFQKLAITLIERNESVLVAAHTSAGKTAVAEYVIAQSLRDRRRVIYTSPIKALSNQKYREFSEEFGDVGLMTGDVTISPNAACLVMTTEILRAMLYRRSEMLKEVAWVIFDEVHYMRDKARGVVWEEILIMLPFTGIRPLFLSATIPNSYQFISWISELYKQPCHVVSTEFRPTPLQHYLFPRGGDAAYLIMDKDGNFIDENYKQAVSIHQSNLVALEASRGRKRQKSSRESDLSNVIKMVLDCSYHPAIVFSFAKHECETLAQGQSNIDFNTAQEHELVSEVFANAIASLDEVDCALPQIDQMLPLLKRGIGIHHSGLLPVLREVIELLFQDGLIKVLFATETFSIGLNMPAKTVVFTSVRKFDGEKQRRISSSEFIQMSGRAGRRGIDGQGIVILMMDETLEENTIKCMIREEPDPLNSAFRASYNMVLNMLLYKDISPEYVSQNSFLSRQSKDELPSLKSELDRQRYKLSQALYDPAVANYLVLEDHLRKYAHELRTECNRPELAAPFLTPGRLCRVEHNGVDYGVGVIVKYSKCLPPSYHPQELASHMIGDTIHVIDVVLDSASENGLRKLEVVPILLSAINGLSSIVVKLPSRLEGEEAFRKLDLKLKEVNKRFGDEILLLDPAAHLKVDAGTVSKLEVRIKKVKDKMAEMTISLGGAHLTKEKVDLFKTHLALKDKCKDLADRIQSIEDQSIDELKRLRHVLRQLKFISANGQVEFKGKVAHEIMSEHNLLLTELMFQGLFNDLSVEQTAALLSVFVHDEKIDFSIDTPIDHGLAEPLKRIQKHASDITKVAIDSGVSGVLEDYINSLNPQLINAVYAWCRGSPFSEICIMSPAFEGSIIRVFRRLEELLRQMAQAARTIGNKQLETQFTRSIPLLKRGIIFSASLYL